MEKLTRIDKVAIILIVVFSLIASILLFKTFVKSGPEKSYYVIVQLCQDDTRPNMLDPVKCGQVPRFIANSLKIGDKRVDWIGNTDIELVDYSIREYGGSSDVKVVLKTMVVEDEDRIYFDNELLEAGKKYVAELTAMNIIGVVQEVMTVDEYEDYVRSSENVKMLVKMCTISKSITSNLEDCGKVPYWFINSLNLGDAELDVHGTVTSLSDYFLEPSSSKVNIISQFDVRTNSRKGMTYYKHEPIKAGDMFTTKLPGMNVYGIVIEILPDSIDYKQEEINLSVLVKGVEPEIVNGIIVGDTFIDPVGRPQLKIIGKSSKPSDIPLEKIGLVIPSEGKLNFEHPFLKDIVVDATVRAREIGGQYYYIEYPLRIGGTIALRTKKLDVAGQIVSLGGLDA